MFVIEKDTRPDPYGHVIKCDPKLGSGYWAAVGTSERLLDCGVGSIRHLTSVSLNDWATKSAFMATLYRANYNPGMCLYTIAVYPDQQHKPSQLEQCLRKIGARKLEEWPNLYHGPCTIELWLVNIRNAVGVYCNEYGEPLETEPNELNEFPPPKALPSNVFAKLPTRNNNEQPTAHPAV